MNINKKICAIVLVFLMVFTTFAFPVIAEESGSFTITYAQPTGATVTLDPVGEHTDGENTYTYTSGTVVTMTVTADIGYELTSIRSNGTKLQGVNGQTSFNYEFDSATALVITATQLVAQTASITVNQSNFTYVLEGADESGMAAIGSNVKLKITPDNGYSVTKILYNGDEVNASNEFSFTVGETNTFDVTVAEKVQKSIIVNVTGEGSVTPNGGSFDVGSDVQLTFSPSTGYILSSLTINGTNLTSFVLSNKYSFTIDQDTIIDVVYTKSITITISVGTGGKVYVNEKPVINNSTVKVAEGSDVTIRVTPSLGYGIDKTTLNSSPIVLDNENSYKIPQITSSKTFGATFKASTETQYKINASVEGEGTISPSGDSKGNIPVPEGKDITFIINPTEGYEVDTVTVDGAPVSIENGQYKFPGVAANHNIFVKFKLSITDGPITVEQVTWTSSDTVTIDIKSNTKVSSEVFKKITDECKSKTVIFTAEKYTWTLPKGADISISSEYADLAVTFNGGNNYNNVVTLLNEKAESLDFILISYGNGVSFPAGTVLSVKMDDKFNNQEVQQLIYSDNKLKDVNIQTVSNGWATINYDNSSDIILCEKLAGYYTIVTSASTGGTINPAGTKSVETGGDASFQITADEGYVISELLVDGAIIAEAGGLTKYDQTFTNVADNHTIAVKFLLQDEFKKIGNDNNSTLIVSIIVVILAFAGFATLFIIRWRQEKY